MNIMNKCLVTKFKAVVDDPDLPYFGEVRFHLKRVLEVDRLKINTLLNPITATILGDNDIVFSENNEKTLILSDINTNIYLKFKGGVIGEEFYVRIVSKYNMDYWALINNGSVDCNAVPPIFPEGTLKYHSNIRVIGYDMAGIVMPITDLIASGNTIILIRNGGNCSIYGDYEEYFVTIWNNGRKSNYINIERCNSNSYFPNLPKSFITLTDNTSAKVTFSEVSIDIKFYNTSTPDNSGAEVIATATYDGSTWTYAMV